MTKRADLLVACMLGQRWQKTQTTAGALVSISSPAMSDNTSKTHLESLWYSLRNFVGAGAAAATVGLEIRHASVGGTLIAHVDHLLAASTVQNIQALGLNYSSKPGKQLFVGTDTALASLTASVNASGWIEDTNG